ncbi:MAG: hypothetical protein JNM43_09015 [Planctomycetaceae bacterium]|nr:hypothetical protein [Planctomycetaceae bacterium]
MESSGVIDQQKLFAAGRDLHRRHRSSVSAGIEALQQSSVRTIPVSVKSVLPVVTEEVASHDEVRLLKELDAIAWSWTQKLSFAAVFVCLIGFAAYSYYDSESQMLTQARTEGREAGELAAVDPIHNIPCPYQSPQTADAWRHGFLEGLQLGREEKDARDAAREKH